MAYAIRQNGAVLSATVGPTPRSAMVNWLWVYTNRKPLATTSDHKIVDWFTDARAVCDPDALELVTVEMVETAVLDAFEIEDISKE